MQGLNRRSWREDPTILSAMQQASHRYGVPLELIEAVIEQESSRGDEAKLRAESEKGALGLMQVLPGTADALPDRQHEIGLFDPYENIRAGTEYLRRMYDTQEEPSWFTALQKYGAGPGNYEQGYRDMYPTEVLARLDAVPDRTLLAGRPELQALLDEPLVTLDPTATDSLFQTLGEQASLTDPTLQDVLANRMEPGARIGLSPSMQAAQEIARAGAVIDAKDAIDAIQAIAPPASDDPASIEFVSDLSDAPIRGRLTPSPTEIGALFPPEAFAGPWDTTLPPLQTERIQPTAEEQAEVEETLAYRDLGILAAQLAAEMGISLTETKNLRGGAGMNPLKGRVGRPLMHRGVPGRGGKLFGTTPQTMLYLGAVGAAGEAARQAYRGQPIELSSGRTFDPTSYTINSLYGFGPSIEGVPFANPTSNVGTMIRTALPGWASGAAETLLPEAVFGGVAGLFNRIGDEAGENAMLRALGKMVNAPRNLTDTVNLGTPGPSTPPPTFLGSTRLRKVLYPTEQRPRDFTGPDVDPQGGSLQTGRVLFHPGEIVGESKEQVANVKRLMEEVAKKTGDDALEVIFKDVMEQQIPLKEIQQVLEANTQWQEMLPGGVAGEAMGMGPTEYPAAINTIRRALDMDAPITLDLSRQNIPLVPQNLHEFTEIPGVKELLEGQISDVHIDPVAWWVQNLIKAKDHTGRQVFTENPLQKKLLEVIRRAKAEDEAAIELAAAEGKKRASTVPPLVREKELAFETPQGNLRYAYPYQGVYGETGSLGANVEVRSGRGEAYTNPRADLPAPTIREYLQRLKHANIAASPEYKVTTPESQGAVHAAKILGDVYRTALEKKLVELEQPGMLQEWQQARKTSKNLLGLKDWILGSNDPTPIWSGKELGWLGLGAAGALPTAVLGGVLDASGGLGTGAVTLGLIGLLRKLGHPYGQDFTGRTVLDLLDAFKHYNPANIVRAYRESEVLPEAIGGWDLDFELRPGSSPLMDPMSNESITVTAPPRDLTQRNFPSRMQKVQ